MEKSFVFYYADHYSPTEGRNMWIYVSKIDPQVDFNTYLLKFKEFIGSEYTVDIVEYDKETFMRYCEQFLPKMTRENIDNNNVSSLIYTMRYHFNN